MISELTGPIFQPCAHTMLKLPAQWVAEIWCRSGTKWMLLALDVFVSLSQQYHCVFVLHVLVFIYFVGP